MTDAVTVVVQQRMLSRQPARTRVELGRETVGIVECFQNRDVTVLIRISIGSLERREKIFHEASGVGLLPAASCSNNDSSLARKWLNELAAGTRHVEDDDPLRRQSHE